MRSVADAAVVLSGSFLHDHFLRFTHFQIVIAGPDPNDNFTLAQPLPVPDFTKALSKNGLKGMRIGVPRGVFSNDSITNDVSCPSYRRLPNFIHETNLS